MSSEDDIDCINYRRSDQGVTLSEAVIEAVANSRQVDPIDPPPLYNAVDLDALDNLFRGGSSGRVEFQYAGYHVSVSNYGSVTVWETQSHPDG